MKLRLGYESSQKRILENPIIMNQNQVSPSVAVVILNYNGKGYLEQFLPSVLASSYSNYRVIIADNASTDDSITFLQRRYPSLELIQLSQNFGFAEGYNQALKSMKSDYYVLLNSDIEVKNDWIEPLVNLLESDKTIGAAQPKILSFHNKTKFEHAGGAGGFMDIFAYPFCRGRLFNDVETDEGQYDNSTEIFWASGAAMFVRAETYHQLEGLDGSYFAHMEEIDLCWRLKRAGFKVMVEPKSVVYHVGGGTLDYDSPFKVFLNFRNSLYTIVKNEPFVKLIWFFIVRLLLDGLAGILFLSKKQYNLTYQIIKAHFTFYGQFFKVLKRRKHYNQLIKKYSIGGATQGGKYPQSIVFQYFIKKKKTFSQLFK